MLNGRGETEASGRGKVGPASRVPKIQVSRFSHEKLFIFQLDSVNFSNQFNLVIMKIKNKSHKLISGTLSPPVGC